MRMEKQENLFGKTSGRICSRIREKEELVRRIEMSIQCLAQYPESYFEGEERNGFYIEPMMKRAWAAQIEVLLEVQKVCEKNEIQYFAEYGTMLGAVRHKGFIPWDDDIV